MIKKCFFLFLFIPLNVYGMALLDEKLVIDKERMTPSSREVVASHIETIPAEKTFTSPYHALSQKETSLFKSISRIEEKIEEEPEVYFTVIIPDKVRLKFDENLYHNIKRELEKIARCEKKELEERRRKILLEKQRLVEIEAEKIKELKMKIAEEEKERFEEKMELIEEEIEQELARRKITREEKILASKKIEEEMLAKEKYIKEQERKAQLETKRKADEEKIDKQRKEEEKKRLAEEQKEAERLKKEELKKAKMEKQEEKKKKEEKEKKELEGYKEVDLDKILDRELPVDTKLTIDGTKVIDIKAGSSEYLDSKRRKNKEKPAGFTSGIDIHQELIVKLKGVIKEKINVNVDYSDIDNNKKQNFYINYQGDKKEVIQKVEFGDVKFTAPNTEFVGYNQQVFGVSAEAKIGKKTNLWGIASRSKGIRVTKEFKGDKRIVNINSVDTAYISQKYYHLAPAEIGTISTPITLEAVYIDDRNGQNNETVRNIGAIAIVSIPTVGTNSHSGHFDIQYAGEDYVFDSDAKILTFKQSIGRSYIVGVVFKDNQGNYFPPEYSRDKNNPGTILMIEPGVAGIEYDVFELKNYYSLGGKNIPVDTDIKLKIIDESGKDFLDMNEKNGRKDMDEYDYLQIFGLDNDFNGKIDDYAGYDYIDHDEGIIKFPDQTPFEIGTGSNPFLKIQTHVDKLRDYFKGLSVSYDPNKVYSEQHKYTIVGSYTLKVKSYMLGYLNIVEGSELVYVDGNLLKKDTDYFIDYDTGFLTFMPHINIIEYTTIKIDYEYTPFIGTRYQKTIAGLRSEFKPNDNFSIGSTYLYEGAPKLKKIPKVSDPTLGNLQVIDVNTSIKVTPILKNLFHLDNNLPVDITISGEVAKSFKNKNTFGLAIIDSMEGVEDSRKISMDETAWQLSSLPEPNLSRGKLLYRKDSSGNLMLASSHRLITEISGPYDYKENVQWEEDDIVDEKVLSLYYTNFGTNSWISIVHPLSNTPLNFTDYTHLEIWMREQDICKIDELYIDLGEISEHADGTGTINRAPHTEDTSPRDYILNKGEDGGWQFKYPDGTVTKIGVDNNQLDTEDLDGNGILSIKEEYFELRFKEFKGTVTIKNPINNWKLWSIPLSKAVIGTGTPRWSAIKQIRLRFKGVGTETTDEIRIGGMAFVGSGRWIIGTVTPAGIGTFNVSSKNAEDDVYDSLRNRSEYKDLYPDEDMKREEALVLKYELERAIIGTITVGTQTVGTTTIYSKGYTYRTFYTAQSYNDYQYLKFWLYGDKQGGKFLSFSLLQLTQSVYP